jgi:hypothetical protein
MNFWDEIFGHLPNPFTTQYLKDEIDFYGSGDYDDGNGIKVTATKLGWIERLDDYLNKAVRSEREIDNIPILYIDGRVWMSLSWMEVQSMFCPIEMCAGEVGTAGLGMGYFPLRAAARDEVERVDVYEIEPRVIQYFTNRFKDREEFSKINVIEGDARKIMRGKYYDYFLSDIYRNLWSNKAVGDIAAFSKYNEIEHYSFWGIEKVLLAMTVLDSSGFECFPHLNPFTAPICELQFFEGWYFSQWLDSEGAEAYDRWFIEANWKYISHVLRALEKWRPERNFL